MKETKIIFLYSKRLLLREWRRFVLPLLSLSVTTVVMVLVLLLTASSSLFLSEQARDLLGGDVVVESDVPFDIEGLWSQTALTPIRQSQQIDFNATLQSESGTMPASVLVVDFEYPLYGELLLEEGLYKQANENEVYLDKAGSERLSVKTGDKVSFGEIEYTVAGIIVSEPTSLFGGFRFLPRVIFGQSGFERASLDTSLLRAEYTYSAQIDNLTTAQKELLIEKGSENDYSVAIAGSSNSRLQRGLTQVSEFLIIAVLITSVLAAVNVYASTLYLLSVLRRSFAVLLSLGMKRTTLISVLGLTLIYVVILAGIVGTVIGSLLFSVLTKYIDDSFLISLPSVNLFLYGSLSILLIATITSGSFIPAVRNVFSVSPRRVLIDSETTDDQKVPLKIFFFNTISTLIPLALLASFLLKSVWTGSVVILVIVVVYVLVAVLFYLFLSFIYKRRNRFSFWIKSIIAQKKADGLFGIVSFTSLFVALTALSTLVLVQISLERFLVNDLSQTVPTTYVVDIQPSQKDAVLERFNDLTLFANIPSRITEIDGKQIQELLARGEVEIDRELGREFNLTFRKKLLASETVVEGEKEIGKPGEISVDEEFANRAGIEIGSTMTFLIQGFEVKGIVTSLRATDSRSGLPFFYFVLAPEDIGQFPSVNFGYAYFDEARQSELSRFLATNMPNVSVIETQSLGPILLRIVGTLMTLIFVIAVPPLLIATLLITTLVISSYSARRREGARLRALGATRKTVMLQYLAETITLTLFSAIASYTLSVLISFVIGKYYLGLDNSALYDNELVLGLSLIVGLIAIIGLILFKSDTMPLRQLLAYEENH